jgi:hypothetical protein
MVGLSLEVHEFTLHYLLISFYYITIGTLTSSFIDGIAQADTDARVSSCYVVNSNSPVSLIRKYDKIPMDVIFKHECGA